MKIAAIVICYHPDELGLYKNIKAFINDVDKLIVWRNSEVNFSYFTEWEDKILFMGDAQNEYIAKPLNTAISWCKKNNYDFLLTMDQDSEWQNFSEFIRKIDTKEDKIAIYAPNTNKQFRSLEKPYYDVEWVIQSGMLLNVNLATFLGGFREDYKIYGVDEEFCNWVRLNGYITRVLANCHLKQRYGRKSKTLFGFETLNYSPIVRYFLIRNMIWMKREFNDSVGYKRLIFTFLYHSRGIILGECDKFKKVSKLVKDVFDGCFHMISKRPNL